MHDANGGAKYLCGRIFEAPIKIGNLTTYTTLDVADHVPFDLLLGRTWQRDNGVTIDERKDGTYLMFKDEQLQKCIYEVLVQPVKLTAIQDSWHQWILLNQIKSML